MASSIGQRLEQYTLKRPQEVLIVTTISNGEEDQVAIFRGFSSSLMRSTAFDPEVPVLEGEILSIDRVLSPYNPSDPQYIEKGLSGEEMQKILLEVGV